MTPTADWGTAERRLNANTSVLVGAEHGKYPSANSLLVRGRAETALIDPSIEVVARGGAPTNVDAVLNSHAHEDHMAGNTMFASARVHIHEADLGAARDIDVLLDSYGLAAPQAATFRTELVEVFHFSGRPDATGFGDGAEFDLGGTTVTAIHLPGHTAGHSGFVVDNVCYLADIDLTGFGPYYGDVFSNLDDFERSLARAREVDADFYVTSHHKGVIEGRDAFVEMIDAFAAVIERRHVAMLAYLHEPHSIDEMVATRFIYRPHVTSLVADTVERRSAELHVARMIERGEAIEVAPGRYRAR